MVIFLGNEHSSNLYEDFLGENRNIEKDIIVSCQYPGKLPASLVEGFTCVNVHYGLLPRYAGCNPIYWQMMEGDSVGVTLHYMDKDWDSGDIIATSSFPCGNLTADVAYNAAAVIGFDLLTAHWQGILDGTAPRKKQDLTQRRYYNKSAVDFAKEKHLYALNDRRIRALHFAGKQYPTIEVGGLKYELRRV
jgi:methionyl-tRNA formyltransferase